MNWGGSRIWPLLGGLLWLATRGLAAVSVADERQGDVWAVLEENDKFAIRNLDRHYTQGLKMIWLSADDRAPASVDELLQDLPAVGIDPVTRRLGFTFGQNIYTPQNLSLVHPDPNDEPYAGWLYGGLVLQRTGTSFGVPTFENLEVDLGIVGPQSIAQQAQTSVHNWLSGVDPEGWDQQLQTEPAFLLRYGRYWRLTPCAATSNWLDVLPYVGGALGNVQIYGAVGANARLGWNLPQDFGPQTIDGLGTLNGGVNAASAVWSGYIFGGLEGRTVVHDLFLDGNSFRSGPSVDHEPWMAEFRFGAAVRLGRHVEIDYILTMPTQQFKTENNSDQYGSLMLKAAWDW